MKNTITTIPGLLTPFSETSDRAELYNYKNEHKVLWLEPTGDSYYLRDLYDMARGKTVSKKAMNRAARILSQETGKVIVYLPWSPMEKAGTLTKPAAIEPVIPEIPKPPTRKEISETLYWADQVSKNKAGNWVIRRGFFYRHGATAESEAQKVREAFPGVTIIGSGDHWAPFKGGASIKTSSHFWVEFKF